MSYVPSLSELFAGADRIGRKYQTAQEIEAYEQELYEVNKDIEDMSPLEEEYMSPREEFEAGLISYKEYINATPWLAHHELP